MKYQQTGCLERLNELLGLGYQVTRFVKSVQNEHIFGIEFTHPTEGRITLEVGATELGWWLTLFD